MLAVIRTGGKQYVVSKGDKIKIEKLNKKEGSEIAFKDVLLMEKGKKLEIGQPKVSKAKVLGKVIRQARDKKVIIFKSRPSKRYKVKRGHRQPFTEVEITGIEMAEAKESK